MIVIPFKGRVFIPTAGEGEFSPALNLERLGDFFHPVIRVDLDHLEDFLFIRSCLVIHDQINVHGNAVFLTFRNGFNQCLFGAIFGAYRTFLVIFAQIV
ncbi:hypothetical protein D3C78_1146300 [compost metagenome]